MKNNNILTFELQHDYLCFVWPRLAMTKPRPSHECPEVHTVVCQGCLGVGPAVGLPRMAGRRKNECCSWRRMKKEPWGFVRNNPLIIMSSKKNGGTRILIKTCFYLEMSGYCRKTYETKQEHFIEGHL